jgi:hypothetical protein
MEELMIWLMVLPMVDLATYEDAEEEKFVVMLVELRLFE